MKIGRKCKDGMALGIELYLLLIINKEKYKGPSIAHGLTMQ